MRVLVQRVHHASCTVNQRVVGSIQKGYVLFVGFKRDDTIEQAQKMAHRILNARLFEDVDHKLNLNILALEGQILSISQFTLYANTKKGNRPSFDEAAQSEVARTLYTAFNEELRKTMPIETGIFQAHMDITVSNDGPLSVLYEN